MVCLNRSYPFKFFEGCLPQILLCPFLNILSHLYLGCLRNHINLVVCLHSDNDKINIGINLLIDKFKINIFVKLYCYLIKIFNLPALCVAHPRISRVCFDSDLEQKMKVPYRACLLYIDSKECFSSSHSWWGIF